MIEVLHYVGAASCFLISAVLLWASLPLARSVVMLPARYLALAFLAANFIGWCGVHHLLAAAHSWLHLIVLGGMSFWSAISAIAFFVWREDIRTDLIRIAALNATGDQS